MRHLLLSVLAIPVLAQQPAEAPKQMRQPPAPKNLKLLEPGEIPNSMQAFRTALGVRCDFCHVQGNFASDENPHKEIARKMIVLTREINTKFPDGKAHVTCYTCHRGAEEPQTAPPPAAASQ